MKDPLMLLILASVGAFVYFVAVKGVIYPILIVVMFLTVAIWYLANNYISRKMVASSRGEDDFFFLKGQMLNEKETELTSGALAVTPTEIIFYKRKGYMGGVQVVWTCFTNQLESYEIKKVDEKHDGLELMLRKAKKGVKFAAPKAKECEKELRKALGWPEE